MVPWGISPFIREACTQAATPPPSARTWRAREFSSGNHPARSTDTEEDAGTVTWRGAVLRGPEAPYPSMLTTEAVGPGLERMRTMSAPEVVAPVAIHCEVRGAAHPTALRPPSSPPPWPTRVRAVGMTPPLPVMDAGAGLVGADASEDQVEPAATLVVSKGSTIPEGHARCTCDGWALCAVPSTLLGEAPTHTEAEAMAATAIPAPTRVVRELMRGFVISSSTRIGRWRGQRPGTHPRRCATE